MNDKTTIEQELRAGHSVVTYTKGKSMLPLLQENQTYVIIQPVKEELQIGQLPICFLSDRRYLIHRIVKKDEQYYYTRGDNCIGIEKIPKYRVLGIVTEIHGKKKDIKVDDFKYKLYVKIWMLLTPVRILYYRLRNFAIQTL